MSEIEALKIREDLIISRQEEGDKVYAIVKDPQTQKFFRLGGTSYLVLQELNGRTSLQEIQHLLAENYMLTVSVSDLEEFVASLEAKGLLGEARGGAARPWRVDIDLLHLRVKLRLFNPDFILSYLSRRLSFLFNRYFLFLSMALIAFGLVVTVLNWNLMFSRLDEFGHFRNLVVLVWAIPIVVIGIHELSHGVTCKFFGGTVREMGIILIGFILPGIYCNLSDIRLLDDKKERLAVLLAGVYSGFFIWSLGVILWLLAPVGSTWELVWVSLIINASLLSLVNLNPLLPLDGYYVLSEWTNIPNLRHRSFRYVLEKKLFGHPIDFQINTRREKSFYFGYTISALIFYCILLAIGVETVMWLIGN